MSLVPVLRDPAKTGQAGGVHAASAAGVLRPRAEKTPRAMGCSVRTPQVRYTEWRDWKTGRAVARELYDAASDPAEMQNAIDDPRLAAAQREAAELLGRQFPTAKH